MVQITSQLRSVIEAGHLVLEGTVRKGVLKKREVKPLLPEVVASGVIKS